MLTADVLRSAVSEFEGAATVIARARGRQTGAESTLGAAVDRLPAVWSSPLAVETCERGRAATVALRPVIGALGEAEVALRALTQRTGEAAAALRHHELAEEDARAALAATRRQLAASGDDPATVAQLRRREQELQAREVSARAARQHTLDGWEQACRRTAAELVQHTHRLRGTASATGLELATGLAAGTAGGAGFWTQLRDFLFGDLLSYWGGDDHAPPVGAGLAALVRVARMSGWAAAGGVAAGFPTLANGGLGRVLSGVPGLSWLTNPVTQRVLTGTGVVGGLFTGVTGAWELTRHGHPVTAFQQHGAGYTADVSRTVFGFGTAGVAGLAVVGIAAPPVLIGVTVVAGVAWIGSEVVAHWDTISGWVAGAWDTATDALGDAWAAGTSAFGTAWEATTDAWDAGAEALSTAWETGVGLAGDLGDGAGSVWGAATDTVTEGLDAASDALAGVPLVGGLFGP